MRHPLNEQTSRFFEVIKHPPNAVQIRSGEVAKFLTNQDSFCVHRLTFRRWTPNVYLITRGGETACDELGVVANATQLRRVFGRDDVPGQTICSIELWFV